MYRVAANHEGTVQGGDKPPNVKPVAAIRCGDIIVGGGNCVYIRERARGYIWRYNVDEHTVTWLGVTGYQLALDKSTSVVAEEGSLHVLYLPRPNGLYVYDSRGKEFELNLPIKCNKCVAISLREFIAVCDQRISVHSMHHPVLCAGTPDLTPIRAHDAQGVNYQHAVWCHQSSVLHACSVMSLSGVTLHRFTRELKCTVMLKMPSLSRTDETPSRTIETMVVSADGLWLAVPLSTRQGPGNSSRVSNGVVCIRVLPNGYGVAGIYTTQKDDFEMADSVRIAGFIGDTMIVRDSMNVVAYHMPSGDKQDLRNDAYNFSHMAVRDNTLMMTGAINDQLTVVQYSIDTNGRLTVV